MENLYLIEAQIKKIVGEDPFDFYLASHEGSVYNQIDELLEQRADCLNRLFRCTPDDVKRVEVMNETLLDMCNSLLQRLGMLYRSTVTDRDKAFDDDYEFEGELRVSIDFDKNGCKEQTDVLRFPDDDFYGSDFYYMAYVVQENEKCHRGSCSNIFSCRPTWNRKNPDSMLTDKALGLVNEFEDGKSWIHPFNISNLDHICICYAIHNMLCHHHWSWPDLIRVNSYWGDVKATCQKFYPKFYQSEHKTNEENR